MLPFLEKELELLEELLKKDVGGIRDFDEIETELKRYSTALSQNNERNRRDAIKKLVGLFEIPESSKRTRSFGEELEEVSLPPQIRELFNATIHNLRSRTTNEVGKTAPEPDNKINERTESNQNS